MNFSPTFFSFSFFFLLTFFQSYFLKSTKSLRNWCKKAAMRKKSSWHLPEELQPIKKLKAYETAQLDTQTIRAPRLPAKPFMFIG